MWYQRKVGGERFSTFLKAPPSPIPCVLSFVFYSALQSKPSVECLNYDTILHRAIQYKLLPSEKFARTVLWCQVHSHIASIKRIRYPDTRKHQRTKSNTNKQIGQTSCADSDKQSCQFLKNKCRYFSSARLQNYSVRRFCEQI